MTKAVLVMDMPEACFECGFCHFAFGEDRCQALESRKVKLEDGKPDWCPLRELPEKMELCGKYPRPGKPVPSYRCGWNACLREILK